jgi:hypothetical protein
VTLIISLIHYDPFIIPLFNCPIYNSISQINTNKQLITPT